MISSLSTLGTTFFFARGARARWAGALVGRPLFLAGDSTSGAEPKELGRVSDGGNGIEVKSAMEAELDFEGEVKSWELEGTREL